MSRRSTRKIVSTLLEDEFEEPNDFKDVYGDPKFRTFFLGFDFGAEGGEYEILTTIPAYLLEPAGDDSDAVEKIVKDYAKAHLSDEADAMNVGFIPRDDWDWLVNVEETDPQPPIAEAEDWEEDDFKDVWGEPPPIAGGYGYFVYFSRPIAFSTPWGERSFTKIGPFRNTYEANRKLGFGLMDEENATGYIKRERITDVRWGAMFEPKITPPVDESEEDEEDFKDVAIQVGYYPVYDNQVNKEYLFRHAWLALGFAKLNRTGQGIYGVVDDQGNVVTTVEPQIGESEEDDEDFKDIAWIPVVTNRSILNWLKANGMHVEKVKDEGPFYRTYTGSWQSGQAASWQKYSSDAIVAYWSRVLLAAGLSSSQFLVGYTAVPIHWIKIQVMRDAIGTENYG